MAIGRQAQLERQGQSRLLGMSSARRRSCSSTSMNRIALEARLPAWRSLLALGA